MKEQSLLPSRAVPIMMVLAIFSLTPAYGFQSVYAAAFKRQRSGVDPQQWEADLTSAYKTADLHRLNMKDEMPVLIEALNSGESFIEHRAAAILVVLATTEFPEYREALRAAVPAMEKHIDYPDEPYGRGFWKEKTILFIAAVDPSPSDRAINAMIDALDDEWTPTLVAVDALIRINPMPKRVWETMLAKMEASPRIKWLALERMWVHHVTTPEALEVIIAALDNEEKGIQLQAAEALFRLGTDAKRAMPALRRLANNPDVDSEVAEKVHLAIQSLEGKKRDGQ